METGSQLALNIVKRRMEGKDSFGKDQEAMKLANQIFKVGYSHGRHTKKLSSSCIVEP